MTVDLSVIYESRYYQFKLCIEMGKKLSSGSKLSERLQEIVNALPIKADSRIIEIGCGPGAAAREIARRLRSGHILAIDRSDKAIKAAIKSSREEIDAGVLTFRCIDLQEFALETKESVYDFAFAIRVGALDGRHPKDGVLALPRIAKALKKNGRLFIDGGDPLKEILLNDYR